MLLLDTHIAVWLNSGDARLRAHTRTRIDEHWRSGDSILLSAVTAWEIAVLVDVGRLDLDVPAEAWVERFLQRPGVEAVPLGHLAASRSYRLENFTYRDPADRLLIATAIEMGCPLVTYDRRITRFADEHGRRYRFAVAD